ncbi:uncharacterized protein LOC143890379 [Tasmannia lanceolata]|uniref:uncharacterized protein LOC143890379 n=1 Tax=Tasmannia lanceolata TaxID=3420 RepID=UPI004063AFBD
MAFSFCTRTLISKPSLTSSLSISSIFFSRSFTSSHTSVSLPLPHLARSFSVLCLRPLVALTEFHRIPADVSLRCLSTRPTTSSLNDPSPNWSNRPPKETILLDGCDFEHWLVVMEPPDGNPTRDEIIDSYIKTLASVLGSEEEAKKSLYSVSTRHYFAFGCIVSEELSYKIKTLPKVRWVLPDSYLDVKNKDYGGEPFIDGQAVPYDPKYHEEWVRNNARANERSRRNDRPRNFDRSRNFERRRENMQNRDFQNRGMPPMPNQDGQNMQNPMPGRDMPPVPNQNMQSHMPGRDMPPVPNQNVQNTMPRRDMPPMPGVGGMPNRETGAGGEYYGRDMPNRDAGGIANRDYQNRDTPNSYGSMPNRDYQNRDMPNREMGRMPGRDYQSQGMPNIEMGGLPNRDYQSSYTPNRGMGNMPSGDAYQGRDVPGRDLPPMPNRDYQ